MDDIQYIPEQDKDWWHSLPMLDLYEQGFLRCCKRKRGTDAYWLYMCDFFQAFPALRNSILYQQYHPEPLRSFLVFEPVLREIFAPEFCDRIVHHYLIWRFEPLLELHLIGDTYSCRKGRGTTFGIKRLHRFIAIASDNYQIECWVLQCDLSGYFMSIDQELLWMDLLAFMDQFASDWPDKHLLLYLFNRFIFSPSLDRITIRGDRKKWVELPDNKSFFVAMGSEKPNVHLEPYTADDMKYHRGFIIGAVPSQELSNFFLNKFDHDCKHLNWNGRVLYGRYVDDFFFVSSDKEALLALRSWLEEQLTARSLTLHPDKIKLRNAKEGIPFLGAYVRGGAILPGKRVLSRFKALLYEIDHLPPNLTGDETIERYAQRINSYLGLFSQFDSKSFVREQFNKHPKLRLFFKWSDCTNKVVTQRSILLSTHKKVMKEAIHRYHLQFQKRNAHKQFYSKAELYSLVYAEWYGTLPPVRLHGHLISI